MKNIVLACKAITFSVLVIHLEAIASAEESKEQGSASNVLISRELLDKQSGLRQGVQTPALSALMPRQPSDELLDLRQGVQVLALDNLMPRKPSDKLSDLMQELHDFLGQKTKELGITLNDWPEKRRLASVLNQRYEMPEDVAYSKIEIAQLIASEFLLCFFSSEKRRKDFLSSGKEALAEWVGLEMLLKITKKSALGS